MSRPPRLSLRTASRTARKAASAPDCRPPAPRLPLTVGEARAALVGPRTGPGHVLGIDQATTSGWALCDLETRKCVLSGVARGAEAQQDALSLLARVPGHSWPSTLVVFEDHRGIPASEGIPTAGLLSLGEARGRWAALLSQAGQSEEARVLAAPDAWRRLLGTRRNLPRKAWKAQAVMWASAITGRRIESDDEAEAVVIAMWGAHEGLVRWATERAEVGACARARLRSKGKSG